MKNYNGFRTDLLGIIYPPILVDINCDNKYNSYNVRKILIFVERIEYRYYIKEDIKKNHLLCPLIIATLFTVTFLLNIGFETKQ